jgi:hypothetical protein
LQRWKQENSYRKEIDTGGKFSNRGWEKRRKKKTRKMKMNETEEGTFLEPGRVGVHPCPGTRYWPNAGRYMGTQIRMKYFYLDTRCNRISA